MRDDSRKVMAEHEARYIEETGIKTLRVRHNNILGFFIEVTQLNAKPLLSPPLSERFRHRQTMANAVRFVTSELLETEGLIASASERALNLEQEIFVDLAESIAAAAVALGAAAAALAELDVFASLAHIALEQGYVRPVIDNSLTFEIRGGRHPVVQQALAKNGEAQFIENDCVLGKDGSEAPAGFERPPEARIWLVTGPNMAGKSTFLRQNALIVVLAQAGQPVPAEAARIGVVDRLFSRVGAADDLARGRSTFMVEMTETAAILHQAGPRSLVVVDEIGRGTATMDGLAIAWAVLEALHSAIRCRTIFATHFHELAELATRLPRLRPHTMRVKEWKGTVVFLHEVAEGAAGRSWGVHVAELAGVPAPVVRRAASLLSALEKHGGPLTAGAPLGALPLFAATAQPDAEGSVEMPPDAVRTALGELDPDKMTPREALDVLYRLKGLTLPVGETR